MNPTLKRILLIISAMLLGIIIIVLILGFLPLPWPSTAAAPSPAITYEDALARFKLVQQSEADSVADINVTQLMTHGSKTPRVYVLIHGITSSPKVWEEFGQMLYERGSNVLLVRMPYHGLLSNHVRELAPLTPQDLNVFADQTIDIAAGLGDKVVVAGLSGGGSMAAWMAQNRAEVCESLLLDPFFGVKQVPDFLTTFVMHLAARLPNIVLINPSEPYREWTYRGNSTRAIGAFLAIGNDISNGLKASAAPACPVNVITTAVDDTANNISTARIVGLMRQSGVDVITFEFDESQNIQHNPLDLAYDQAKQDLVYGQMLEMLGETP